MSILIIYTALKTTYFIKKYKRATKKNRYKDKVKLHGKYSGKAIRAKEANIAKMFNIKQTIH